MPYRTEYSDRARSDLRRVPGNYRQRAKRLIASLADNPRPPKARNCVTIRMATAFGWIDGV